MEVATAKVVVKMAVSSWLNPMSSSHMDKNDSADHGNEPLTPCATKTWNVGIWIMDLASMISSLASSSADFLLTGAACEAALFVGKWGSTAKNHTRMPTMTLTTATRWKAIRHPSIPKIVV